MNKIHATLTPPKSVFFFYVLGLKKDIKWRLWLSVSPKTTCLVE